MVLTGSKQSHFLDDMLDHRCRHADLFDGRFGVFDKGMMGIGEASIATIEGVASVDKGSDGGGGGTSSSGDLLRLASPSMWQGTATPLTLKQLVSGATYLMTWTGTSYSSGTYLYCTGVMVCTGGAAYVKGAAK